MNPFMAIWVAYSTVAFCLCMVLLMIAGLLHLVGFGSQASLWTSAALMLGVWGLRRLLR